MLSYAIKLIELKRGDKKFKIKRTNHNKDVYLTYFKCHNS